MKDSNDSGSELQGEERLGPEAVGQANGADDGKALKDRANDNPFGSGQLSSSAGDLLGGLPQVQPGPVSPLQMNDGGEALYGARWWLRPQEAEAATDEPCSTPEQTSSSTSASPDESELESSDREGGVERLSPVVALDRKPFDEIPTVQDSEKGSKVPTIAVIAVAIAIAAVVLSQL